MIPATVHSKRLTLVLLNDPSPDGQHLAWFHENWSDPDATSWSVSGISKSLQDSERRFLHLLSQNNYFYSVFLTSSTASPGNPGHHLGSIGLRTQSFGTTIPALTRKPGDEAKELDLRILGYAYFKHAWGKGYATEAARALLDAYGKSVKEEKAKGEKCFYVEVGVDEGNPASVAIVRKLGFEKVGFKEEKEPAFLGGEWRYNGYWIYGMYV